MSLAYQAAHQYYKFFRELPAGKGFADIVLVPYRNVDKPAIVIELKYNKSAEGAITQIKEKQYSEALRDYVGEIVLVGINYDERTKQHECKIERITTDKSAETADKTADKRKRLTAVEAEKIIIEFALNQGGVVRQAEVSRMIGLSERQTRDYLSNMAARGIFHKYGANKDRTYKLR